MDDFSLRFDIGRTVACIAAGGYTRIALQLPDYMLSDAVRLQQCLQQQLPAQARLYLMADTAFGSCCVDEVAASHVDAQLIVHYGRSCLSRTSRIPTLHVLGRRPVNVAEAAQQFRKVLSDCSKPTVLVADTDACYALDKLAAELRQFVPQLTVATVDPRFTAEQPVAPLALDAASKSVKPDLSTGQQTAAVAATAASTATVADAIGSASPAAEPACCASSAESCGCECNNASAASRLANLHLSAAGETSTVGSTWSSRFGRCGLPDPQTTADGVQFLFVGDPVSPFLLTLAMTFNQTQIYSYDPEKQQARLEDLNVNRRLKRRYFLVQKAKDAQVIGLLAGTLGVARYNDVIQRLKKQIRQAGKRFYTILVGKPNPAKLANFTEVDVFVLIACPESTLTDSSDFLVPVVTPFEFELSCQTGFQWTGRFETDFVQLLREAPILDEDEKKKAEEEDEPHFSFLSGKFMPRSEAADGESPASSTALQTRADADRMQITGLARSLKDRTFQGLDPQLGQTEVTTAVKGRKGIAIGYEEEPK